MVVLLAIWRWLQVVGGAVAAVAVCWLLAQSAFHLRLLNVQTGSMTPSFRPHDALIMQRVDASQLRVGMVVSYRSTRNPNELVTHRIVRVIPATNSFQTKGDALTAPDPVVRDSLAVGRIVAVLPGMGKPLGWVQTWTGLVVCVYIPAAAIAVSELRRFERRLASRNFYQLRQA